MKSFGLKGFERKLLWIAMLGIVIMFLLPGYSAGAPAHTGQHYVVMASSSGNGEYSELHAYIVGIPTQDNPFGGYSFANQTSQMPTSIEFFVYSNGNSSVQVSMSGSTDIIHQQFAWNITIPYTLAAATYLVSITIYSQTLQLTKTVSYTIEVMTYTQYVSYLNAHNALPSTQLLPWYDVYGDVEIATLSAIIVISLFFIYAHSRHEAIEKKTIIFDVR